MTQGRNGKSVSKKFVTFYGLFIDTPRFGAVRIRENTAVGVCLDPSEPSQYGRIQFIVEGSEDPLEETLKFIASLTEKDIEIVTTKQFSKVNFFFPGFIDTHIHASQYPNAGILGNDSTLLDWLNKYTFPTESALKNLKLANNVYNKIIKRTLTNGTTTATYFTTIDINASKLMAKLCSINGQRAMIGKVCMDSNSPDYYIESTQESIDSLLQLIDFLRNDLQDPKIKPIVTPRFAPSCSRELMTEIGNIAQSNNLHIQTHLSENSNEIQWVKDLFPECLSYTDVYEKYKILYHKTVLAHCVHLTEQEIQLIISKNSGIAHCPISNTSLASGRCPVKRLYKSGIHKIGLGTDVSAGYSPSILMSARNAYAVSRHIAIDDENANDAKLSTLDCLYLATVGGAKVLDMEYEIGSFETGKFFDCQEIDLMSKNSTIDIFDWQLQARDLSNETEHLPLAFDYENIIGKWFFNADDRNVVSVWVNGNKIKI